MHISRSVLDSEEEGDDAQLEAPLALIVKSVASKSRCIAEVPT
jgi:hypothetical protein